MNGDGPIPLIIERVRQQTPDVRSFNLRRGRAGTGHGLGFIPGQVALLRVADEEPAYFAFAAWANRLRAVTFRQRGTVIVFARRSRLRLASDDRTNARSPITIGLSVGSDSDQLSRTRSTVKSLGLRCVTQICAGDGPRDPLGGKDHDSKYQVKTRENG